MTNLIPGADSERAAFEAWAKAACEIPFYAAINWNAVWTKAAWEGWQARAAAKVGANVAAPVTEEHIHTWINGIGGGIWKDGALTLRRDELVAAIRGIVNLAAGAPAETPKPIVECPRYDFGCGRIESLWCDNCPERTTQPSPAPIAGDVEKDAATVDFSYLVDGAPYVTSVDKANGGMAVIIYYSSRGYGNAAFNRIADAYHAAMLANSSSVEAG